MSYNLEGNLKIDGINKWIKYQQYGVFVKISVEGHAKYSYGEIINDQLFYQLFYNPYSAHEQIVDLILDDGKKIQIFHVKLLVRDDKV